jgi:hypothetical protein
MAAETVLGILIGIRPGNVRLRLWILATTKARTPQQDGRVRKLPGGGNAPHTFSTASGRVSAQTP